MMGGKIGEKKREKEMNEENEKWERDKARAHALYMKLRERGWKDWQKILDMRQGERNEFLKNNLVILLGQNVFRDKYIVQAKGQTYEKREFFKSKEMEWDPWDKIWSVEFEWGDFRPENIVEFAEELAEKTGAKLYYYDW